MTVTIYGASDDLVEVAGCEGADEFNVRGRWQGDLVAPGGTEQMRVHCWYDDDGCWQVGVGQATRVGDGDVVVVGTNPNSSSCSRPSLRAFGTALSTFFGKR